MTIYGHYPKRNEVLILSTPEIVFNMQLASQLAGYQIDLKTTPSEVDIAIYACTDETIIITPNIAIQLAISEKLNRLTQATWNLPLYKC